MAMEEKSSKEQKTLQKHREKQLQLEKKRKSKEKVQSILSWNDYIILCTLYSASSFVVSANFLIAIPHRLSK